MKDRTTDVPAAGAGRLVAVVVTHNRLQQLQRTLERLLAAPPAVLARVLVVDNASSDGTAGFLAGLAGPRLAVLRSETNLGGAGGFALGIRQAAEAGADWIVVMDDDARPAPGALAAFQAAALAGWDAVAAAVYYPAGGICEMNRPALNPFAHAGAFLRTALRGRSGFHLGPAEYAGGPRPVDVASFVGLFLSRRAVALAGYPDPRLFVYGDDGLYTLALTRAGGRIGFLPQLRFEHDCSTLSEGGTGRFRPLWKAYYYHRNLLLLYRLAAGPWFWPALAVVLPKWLAKARHHRGARRRFLALLARAVRDGLAGRLDVPHGEIAAMGQGERP